MIAGIFWFVVGLVLFVRVMELTKHWPMPWSVLANVAVYVLFGYMAENMAVAFLALAVAVFFDSWEEIKAKLQKFGGERKGGL